MTKAPKTKRRGRLPKVIEPEEVAAILAFASLHNDKKAAAEYNVSTRTIQRFKADVRDGKRPEVAKLIASQRQRALERNQDLLVETHDKFLRQMQEKCATFNNSELIEASKMLGELRQDRDLLRDPDGDVTRASSEASGKEAVRQPAPRRAGEQASGADEGRSPVH